MNNAMIGYLYPAKRRDEESISSYIRLQPCCEVKEAFCVGKYQCCVPRPMKILLFGFVWYENKRKRGVL